MKLSVIIPAHNEAKYIARTLNSIQGAEKIVVCNGCTDNTAELARKHADKVIEINEANVSKARNVGAKASSNDRLIFLDADTIPSKSLLEKISRSKYSVGASKVKPDSKRIIEKLFMVQKTLINKLFRHCSGMLFCDKDLFNAVGGFRENLSKREDTTFLDAAAKNGHFGVVNAYVYTSMRRYRKKGYIYLAWYWLKENIKPSKKKYEVVR